MLKMKTNLFAGDKKIGKSLLSGPENRFKYWAVPKIPHFIETYHLTLLTLLWSIINVVLGFYAKNNVSLLWLVSAMIVLQYITDLFDGELGRQRDTGLIINTYRIQKKLWIVDMSLKTQDLQRKKH